MGNSMQSTANEKYANIGIFYGTNLCTRVSLYTVRAAYAYIFVVDKCRKGCDLEPKSVDIHHNTYMDVA